MNVFRAIWERRTPHAITLVVASSSAILMLITMGTIHWARRAADARLAEVLRGRETIARVYALARSASQLQTSRASYVLTHEQRALSVHQAAIEESRRDLLALSGLLAGDERQRARLARAGELLEGMIQDDSSYDPLGFSSALSDAQRRAASAQMRRLDALQSTLNEVVGAQASAVEGDARASRELNRYIDLEMLLATCLVVSWALGSVLLISREVTLPLAELRASAEAIARGDLDRRVKVRRTDEIGSLALSFNSMADQLRRQRRANEVLRELRELMHGVQDVEEVDRLLALLVPDCFPDTTGDLYLLDEAGDGLVPRGGWGMRPPAAPFAASTCWAYRLGRPHEASDDHPTVRCSHPSLPGRSSVCFPLGARGSISGILQVTFEGPTPRGITEIGETLALALANIRLRDEMREEAQHDPLTALLNRRAFDQALQHELAQAALTDTPFALALMDLDHFKRFNDLHGHAVGDAVLRELAATLCHGCRGSDVACRYGGEEFVVLLPGCGLEDGLRKAEGLRAAVAAMKLQAGGGDPLRVTVSIGVAAFPSSGRSTAELIAAADKALYRSKEGGRDRVTSAPPLPPVVAAE